MSRWTAHVSRRTVGAAGAAAVVGALLAPAATPAAAATAPHVGSLSTYTARVGDTVTLRGTHLSRVTGIRFGAGPATRVRVLSAYRVRAVVPATAATGRLSVFIRSTRFTTTQRLTVAPSFTMSPARGVPTTRTTIAGAGYAAYEAVDLRWDGANQNVAVTNVHGNFGPVTLTVPSTAPSGAHSVVVTGERSHKSHSRQFVVGTNWGLAGFGASQRRDNPFENEIDGSNVRTLRMSWNGFADGFGNRSPHIWVNGVLYVSTVLGNIFAYSDGGTLLWHASTGKDLQRFDPAAANGNVIFGAADGTLLAYKQRCATAGGTCTPVWTTAEGVSGSLNVSNGVLLVPDSDGSVHQVNPTSGASAGAPINPLGRTTPVNAVSVSPSGRMFIVAGTAGTYVTSVSASLNDYGATVSAAAMDGDRAIFTASDGKVRAVGQGGWTATMSAATGCSTAPAVANAVVFAANCDVLGAYSAGDGTPLWSVPVAGVSGISTADDVVYACARLNGSASFAVHAYDAASGARLWSGGSCNDTPVVADGHVLTGAGQVTSYTLSPSYLAATLRTRS